LKYDTVKSAGNIFLVVHHVLISATVPVLL